MKKSMQRLTAFLLAVSMVCLLFTGCGKKTGTAESQTSEEQSQEQSQEQEESSSESAESSETSETAEENIPGDITIIYTNDVHCYINNQETNEDGSTTELLTYGSVAAIKEDLLAEGENVLLVDDGDAVQGTVYGAVDEGKHIIQLMNAAGYDISTLGNHEFDYGQFRVFGIMDEADFPYVCCNFYNTSDGSLVLPAYEILECGGVKVAFIGITTPQTYTAAPKSYFSDENGNLIYGVYGVEDPQDLYDCVQNAIDEIGDSADYIVALGHLGVDPSTDGWNSTDVIAHTTGLDAFIDGHSHSTIESQEVQDASGNTVILTQTGCYLNAVGEMHLSADGVTTELITEYGNRDEEVEAMTAEWAAEIEEELGTKIAVSDDDFTIMSPEDNTVRIIRRMETNEGDLEADAIYYHFNEVEQLNCDVAISNGGGIRTDLPAGDVNYTLMKGITPFGNVICMMEVSGQELLDMLEYSCHYIGVTADDGTPAEFGGFLQVAGCRFEVDSSIESTVQLAEDTSWAGSATGEYKVSNVQIYNRETGEYEDLDLTKTYTVAGNNYILRNGGNGYTMFSDASLVKDYVGEDYLIEAEYVMAFAAGEDGYAHICTENSPLAAYSGYLLDYEDPYGSGRITIK